MESIGKRIQRLRKLMDWSRPELGRRMAAVAGRAKPFSGEVIRLYESDRHKPGKAARAALAAVFDRDEAYIEFGEERLAIQSPRVPYLVKQAADRNAQSAERTAQEEILLHLFAGLFKLQRREIIDEMHALYRANEITRKELGQKPLRGVSNADIEVAFGSTPPPNQRRHPKKKHDGGRDPGAAMSDYTEDP